MAAHYEEVDDLIKKLSFRFCCRLQSTFLLQTLRYRFPTGESGADVYDRTKQWWDSMMQRTLRRMAVRKGYMLWERCPVISDDLCLSEDISMKTTRPKQSLSLRMAWQCGSFWCNCFTGPPTPFTLCGAFDEMISEHFLSFSVVRCDQGSYWWDDNWWFASPESLRNPDNCAMYVLKKNTSSRAVYPYYMDDVEGDRAMSSIDLAGCLVLVAMPRSCRRRVENIEKNPLKMSL